VLPTDPLDVNFEPGLAAFELRHAPDLHTPAPVLNVRRSGSLA
jgi:hypothetical protein